jgi:hypothetical protein
VRLLAMQSRREDSTSQSGMMRFLQIRQASKTSQSDIAHFEQPLRLFLGLLQSEQRQDKELLAIKIRSLGMGAFSKSQRRRAHQIR